MVTRGEMECNRCVMCTGVIYIMFNLPCQKSIFMIYKLALVALLTFKLDLLA